MTTVLLSPSEVALAGVFGKDAIVSTIPEEKGADILLYSKYGLVGFQRKSIPNDFITSFTDGRMARALALLVQSCTFTRLIGEGCFRYWPDGTVHLGMTRGNKRVPTRFTRKHIHGMLNDIEFTSGVIVRQTDDVADTVRYVKSVIDYLGSGKHTGLYSRPSAKGTWYVPTAKDVYLWLLQSFPGIGPTIADNIESRFGGEIPLSWTCSLEELTSVPGLSAKRAEIIWEALPTTAARVTGGTVINDLRKLIGKTK